MHRARSLLVPRRLSPLSEAPVPPVSQTSFQRESVLVLGVVFIVLVAMIISVTIYEVLGRLLSTF